MDTQISPIGLEVMEFSCWGYDGLCHPIIIQEDKDSILKAALDGGINWFDIAE